MGNSQEDESLESLYVKIIFHPISSKHDHSHINPVNNQQPTSTNINTFVLNAMTFIQSNRVLCTCQCWSRLNNSIACASLIYENENLKSTSLNLDSERLVLNNQYCIQSSPFHSTNRLIIYLEKLVSRSRIAQLQSLKNTPPKPKQLHCIKIIAPYYNNTYNYNYKSANQLQFCKQDPDFHGRIFFLPTIHNQSSMNQPF